LTGTAAPTGRFDKDTGFTLHRKGMRLGEFGLRIAELKMRIEIEDGGWISLMAARHLCESNFRIDWSWIILLSNQWQPAA